MRQTSILPRVMNVQATAGYIGRSGTWFRANRAALEGMGFPKPLPVLDGYDRAAVDDWLDGLGGKKALKAMGDGEAWLRAADG